MKAITILVLLLSLSLLSGCSSTYTVTLTNGRVITASSKPKLDKAKNRYVFKDTSGEPVEVAPLIVREIAPSSMSSSKFNSSGGR